MTHYIFNNRAKRVRKIKHIKSQNLTDQVDFKTIRYTRLHYKTANHNLNPIHGILYPIKCILLLL